MRGDRPLGLVSPLQTQEAETASEAALKPRSLLHHTRACTATKATARREIE